MYIVIVLFQFYLQQKLSKSTPDLSTENCDRIEWFTSIYGIKSNKVKAALSPPLVRVPHLKFKFIDLAHVISGLSK